MEVALAIASKIAEYTVAPVGRQLGYIFFYKSNVGNLKTQFEKLEGAKNALQHSVDAAKRNGEEIEGNVQNWLIKVGSTVEGAKRFQENEGHAKAGCSDGSFPNLWSRHLLSRKAKKMAVEISEVLVEGKFDKISYLPPLPVASKASARDYKALVSRTSVLNEIMQVLKDDSIYMVGLYGMGGVGKSTLIKELAWQAEQNGSFGVVIRAIVTNSPDLKNIQGQLADGLDLTLKEETKEGRAQRLYDRIRKEKRILIIIDDLWERLDLAEVGVPFGDDYKGCKLLVTSRDLNVLNCEMGTQKNFRLEVLSKEESWSLFEKMAGDAVKDVNLQPTAFKVANSCAGLPLLIVTVARALKNKELPIWKDALNELIKFDHAGLGSKVYSAIELSCNYLESDELKSFFLLISSLRNTSSTKDLLIYGWGSGLYKHVDTLAEARNRVSKLINDLRASCLLLEGKKNWVRMHDVIYDVASSIASKAEPFFAVQYDGELIEWPKMDWLKRCQRIFLNWCYIKELPKTLECPELKILLIASKDNYLAVPDNFLVGTRELKVLDLAGLDFTPSLPPSLPLLRKLQALYLYQCMLEDITTVAELTSLEILSLSKSEIRELPKEIGQLTHLKLLDLSDSGLQVIPANLISSLTSLEELHMGNCFIQWEVEGRKSQSNNASISELNHLHHLTTLDIHIKDASLLPKDLHFFEKLERYEISFGDVWKWYGDNEISRTLKLKLSTIINFHLEHGIKLLLDRVEDLYLSEFKGITNVLFDLNQEGFPQLKRLDIRNNAEILYIINSKEWVHPFQAFPNLESLVLRNLVNMEKLCQGTLPMLCFTKLKVIKVKGCDKLNNVFSSSMISNLSQLDEIEISECNFMTHVILQQRHENDSGNDKIEFSKMRSLTLDSLPVLINFYSKSLTADMESRNWVAEYKDGLSLPQALFDEKIAFPNLEDLQLSSINFRKIWDDQLSGNFCIQNLMSLTIDSCDRLQYLFSSSMARGLVKLQYLKITKCRMLEEIFVLRGNMSNIPSTTKALSSEEVTFPNLETLEISHMDNLKSIWQNQLAPSSFCKLKIVKIKFCNKLSNLFPSHVLRKLNNLDTVFVTDCAALEVTFETQGLNTGASSQSGIAIHLRSLTLERLPVLKHIWSKAPQGNLSFQNLCTVTATECESLNHVFPLPVAKKLLQLQLLDIRDCGVENIVAMDDVEEAAPRLIFPQLTSLIFWRLEELRSFYPGKHTLDCPILRNLDVYHCDKLEIFTSKSQNYQGNVPCDPQPLLPIEKIIPNIEELSLSSTDVRMICNSQVDDDHIHTVKSLCLQCFHDDSDKFPSGFLQRFTNLEILTVSCSSFIEVFSSENPDNEHIETFKRLRNIRFHFLMNLKYICKEKSKTQQILQNLESLEVFGCSGLKNIVPSLVLFPNLETLWVNSCAGLVNIISSSTARSFLKLRKMYIHDCEMLEEVVTKEEGDTGEITFMKLEHLELQGLPRLTSFGKGNYSFKFPLLRNIYVIECSKMESFSHGILSAPILRAVHVKDEEYGEWCWDGDLNTTIRSIFNKTNFKED